MSDLAASTSHAELLADFVAGVEVDSLPVDVVHEAKRSLIDWLAAALSGVSDPSTRTLQAVIAEVAPQGPAIIVGAAQTTSPAFAALANGYASHLFDFDDVFNPIETTIHQSSCVWPAIMAAAAVRRITGREALGGFVAGFEAGARVARAAGIRHYESPWQVTGTAGRLAAAAAAARTLELDGGQTVHALGIAAAQASGLREIYGSDTKPLQPGKAAMDGLLAALLAERGFTSRASALEGQRGFLRAVSADPDPRLLSYGLGEAWHTIENGHKLYPSASLTHPAIDAAAAVHARWDGELDPGQIRSVRVEMHPFAADVTGKRHPEPGSDARFSAPHCVAVALVSGSFGVGDFAVDRVDWEPVVLLRDRIEIVADRSCSKRSARVTAMASNGTTVESEILENRGCPGNPLTDAELERKLVVSAGPHLAAGGVDALIQRCWALELEADLAGFLATLRPG